MADMASQLEALAFRLRRAGEEDLARELNTAMRHAVQPVPDRIREGLLPHLPNPYAKTLDDDLDIRTSVRNSGTAGANAAVTVRGTTRSGKRRRFRRLDNGILEHPLWGHRKHWYKQPVAPGWFTGPAEDDAPRVRGALEQALADVGAKAAGKGA